MPKYAKAVAVILTVLVTLATCNSSTGTVPFGNTTTTTTLRSTSSYLPTASITADSLGACRCPASYRLACVLKPVRQGCHGDPCQTFSGPEVITGVCPCPFGYEKTCLPAPPPGCPDSCNTPLTAGTSCDTATTSCEVPDPKNPAAGVPASYCACRAGYKAGAVPDGDVMRQWRLPAPEGSFRVWVATGVSCDALCDDPNTCSEVTELSSECLIYRSQE